VKREIIVRSLWIEHWGPLAPGPSREFLNDKKLSRICTFRMIWIEAVIAVHRDFDSILESLDHLHQEEIERLEREAKDRRREDRLVEERNKRIVDANVKVQRDKRKRQEFESIKKERAARNSGQTANQHDERVAKFANAWGDRTEQNHRLLEELQQNARQASFALEAQLESKRIPSSAKPPKTTCTGCDQPIKPSGLCGCS
jgi:hypothetical protein